MTFSENRLKKLADKPDSEIDFSDIPELESSFFEAAALRMPVRKRPVSIRLDEDVLKWFKSQGGVSNPYKCSPLALYSLWLGT